MTTFTLLDDNAHATLTLKPTAKLCKINENIYGGFVEHMGRCIYGGVYDPSNPRSALINENGFRIDVIESLKELKVPVVRYPGGNFVATYHWLDGVGPRQKRPKRPELAWLGVEVNQFGTDEFMRWCELVGTEPYLTLNFGTGTLDEALGWLEYCNSAGDTYYANLRRQNGHPEPYKVKYWALGNETWGPWQVEQMTKEDYAKKAFQWAKALKLLDPSITLVLCGKTGHTEWDFYTLKECIKPNVHDLGGVGSCLIDMHSIHLYTACESDAVKNILAPRAAERSIEICAGLIDLARICNGVPPTTPKQTICFDEWNVWDPKRAPGHKGAEEQYTLSDALAVAVWLNVFVRQSRYVGMANIAQSVNVISPLLTTPDRLLKQTTWWPLLLFSRYMRGWTLASHLSCTAYEGPTEPAWLASAMALPWLDVSATISEDNNWITLVVVNASKREAITVELSGIQADETPITVFTIDEKNLHTLEELDDGDESTFSSEWNGRGGYRFPQQSMTMLRCRNSSRSNK